MIIKMSFNNNNVRFKMFIAPSNTNTNVLKTSEDKQEMTNKYHES